MSLKMITPAPKLNVVHGHARKADSSHDTECTGKTLANHASFFAGLPKRVLQKLQYSVLNAAARFVSMSGKYDHISLVLIDLSIGCLLKRV